MTLSSSLAIYVEMKLCLKNVIWLQTEKKNKRQPENTKEPVRAAVRHFFWQFLIAIRTEG